MSGFDFSHDDDALGHIIPVMATSLTLPNRPSQRGEPVWELLEFFPEQGRWTEGEYLAINTNRLVELVDGCLEFPPMPDFLHQTLVWLLTTMLNGHTVETKRGWAVCSPFKLRIPNQNWREPDVAYLLPRHLDRLDKKSWSYADLVVEVVSPDDPSRDYDEKRRDYAVAGVPEYWIVDPMNVCIVVLVLEGGAYREVQIARSGDVARSTVVTGFEVDVASLFAQATP